MRKLTVISAITTSIVIVIGILLVVFEKGVINYLVNNNHMMIASMIYTSSKVEDKIIEKDYVGINSSVDKKIFSSDTINNDNSDNEYDQEILTKNDGEDYKVINLEIDGFKSYLVAIYDASKVKLVSSKAFNKNNTGQQTVKEICKRYGASVCINGGGFVDWGTGSDIPQGCVIEDGKITWDSKDSRGLIGFDTNDKLVLVNDTCQGALDIGVRDALEFGPFLIQEGNILVDEDTTVGGFLGAARVAIAQRRDGIVLFLVTEGRHAKGPTVYQIAKVLKQYGAYTASNLDGGASSSLVIQGKLINNPLNIYGQPVNGGNGRSVVTGFGLVK